MFSINRVEALIGALWIIGVACSVASFWRGRRGVGGWALIAAAVFAPIVGSVVAISIFVTGLKSVGIQGAHQH